MWSVRKSFTEREWVWVQTRFVFLTLEVHHLNLLSDNFRENLPYKSSHRSCALSLEPPVWLEHECCDSSNRQFLIPGLTFPATSSEWHCSLNLFLRILLSSASLSQLACLSLNLKTSHPAPSPFTFHKPFSNVSLVTLILSCLCFPEDPCARSKWRAEFSASHPMLAQSISGLMLSDLAGYNHGTYQMMAVIHEFLHNLTQLTCFTFAP